MLNASECNKLKWAESNRSVLAFIDLVTPNGLHRITLGQLMDVVELSMVSSQLLKRIRGFWGTEKAYSCDTFLHFLVRRDLVYLADMYNLHMLKDVVDLKLRMDYCHFFHKVWKIPYSKKMWALVLICWFLIFFFFKGTISSQSTGHGIIVLVWN